MTDEPQDQKENPFKALEPIADAPVTPATTVAALALNLALKFHDMGMIKDAAMYQQFKLEGKNIVPLQLAMVLDTALKMEGYLLGASERIAKIVVDALEAGIESELPESESKPDDESTKPDSSA